LDGAERIIRALLAGDPKKADCIQNLLYDAQETIIEDFLHERKDEFASVIYEVAKSLNSEVKEKDKAEAIRSAVKESLGAFNKQLFSQAIERFHTIDQIRNYLSQPVNREPDRHTTLNSTTRAVRIVGGMLQSVGDETKSAGKFVARLGAILWLLVQAATPGGLAQRFADKLFAALFWFAIVMLLGGICLNQAVQSVGLKLLFVTTLLWLIKDAFQRYMRGGKRALRAGTVLVVAALLVSIGMFTLTDKLQPPHPPQKAYQWVHDRIGQLSKKNAK